MSGRYYCATAARGREDPLPGSAARARRWLLVEYSGGWSPVALTSGALADGTSAELHDAAVAVGGRALLIRRPGRRPRGGAQSWAVVDYAGTQQWGRWSQAEDLHEAAAVMRAGPVALGSSASAGALLLVCAHGLHDVCCAVRGRPVAQALAQRWPEQTWECSHIGGDRFAANLLVLPDGTTYGRLDSRSAVQVAQSHLAGVVDPGYLRGQATEPPVVQAAIAAALERFGPAGPRDLVGAGTVQVRPERWLVTLTGTGSVPGSIEAVVTRRRRSPARLTCHAAQETTAFAYTVTGLRALT
jgi:hypothetical protein